MGILLSHNCQCLFFISDREGHLTKGVNRLQSYSFFILLQKKTFEMCTFFPKMCTFILFCAIKFSQNNKTGNAFFH